MLTSSNSRNSRAALTYHSAFLVFLFCVSLLTGNDAVRAFGRLETSGPRQIPQPSEVLGFTPGDDRKLASWNQVVSYFRRLAETSNRVKLDEIGKSTMGAPFVYATISAPENLSHLKEIMGIQRRLADPRLIGPNPDRAAASLIDRGKTVVLITCGIHSTEVGSTLSSMLIAYRLASSEDAEVKDILRNTVVLLVPSLNPDGVDIVKNWYDKALNTPYEGTDPPELYHKYTGHDDNRDWYAFTQIETRLTVEHILNVWHPQIVHDIHQQGAYGSRLFLPPYMKPVEPNVPKQIVAGYTELGNFIAKRMRESGFQGVTTDSTYDAWTPARAYSHYHGGVRILSETASAKLATPLKIKFSELRPREGYDPQKESRNFGPVWRGGVWRLSDITKTMTTAAFFLLENAARNRQKWLQNFFEIEKEAVAPVPAGEANAYAILPSRNKQRFASFFSSRNSDILLGTLAEGGVEYKTVRTFKLGDETYPTGTAIVPLNQPYGSFAKALLEVQHYPDLRDSQGRPIVPYDVTAQTLPLLMNVEVRKIRAPVNLRKLRVPPYGMNGGCGSGAVDRALYRSHIPTADEGWTRWVLEQAPCEEYARVEDKEIRDGELAQKYRVLIIPDQSPRGIAEGYAEGTMPPELTGGLGKQGISEIRNFVEQGGTLVCLNRASDFAIDQLGLPLRNVTRNLKVSEFYGPGSILRIQLSSDSNITRGTERDTIAWFEDSPVFEVSDPSQAFRVHIIAHYPADHNPLLSGWLLGAEKIQGKAALVEVSVGKGKVILFGFRPQYRGQSLATYPLFFNSIR